MILIIDRVQLIVMYIVLIRDRVVNVHVYHSIMYKQYKTFTQVDLTAINQTIYIILSCMNHTQVYTAINQTLRNIVTHTNVLLLHYLHGKIITQYGCIYLYVLLYWYVYTLKRVWKPNILRNLCMIKHV